MTGHPISYQQGRWSLADIFPSPTDPVVDETLTKLTALTNEIEALRPELSPDISAELFSELFKKIEQFSELAARLGSYGHLWFAEDTQHQGALAFIGRMEQALTDLQKVGS